ncbi:MAG: HAMP domain-containing protein [Methyloprofundus sp.]|nr:HAMP domain-containing protein [Methyloprofundus sp.]
MQDMNTEIPSDLKQALPYPKKKRRWNIYVLFRFGSIFQWTLTALFAVTLPLILTLLYSVWSIQEYTSQGTRLILTINTVNNSKILVGELSDMGRIIKKYQIFEDKDPKIFSAYEGHHQTFLDVATQTDLKKLPQAFRQPFAKLMQKEMDLYNYIQQKQNSVTEKLSEEDIERYVALGLEAKGLLKYGDQQIKLQTTSLLTLAELVEKRVSLATLVSVVLALMLGPILLYLINRPIKRIERAIGRLGNEQFNRHITIEGPSDLREVGEHLEWLRQKLNQLENNKQFFIKTISHELKTPLASLMEGTDLLEDEVVGKLNAEQHKIIELLQIANINLSDLIENLIEYQKSRSILAKMNFSQFNLNQLINNIFSNYQLLLERKKVSIVLEGKTIDLMADRDKIIIIISNLFSNALKFSPDGSQIYIKLEVVDGGLKLLMADQGAGIAPDQLAHIFTEFYQQETPEDWKIKGSGLGLSLVKAYVAAHCGKIEILAPTTEYCGAHFLLTLPLAPGNIDR